jgi:glycosyltransferase involved in cell wall biosynthesis
LPLSVLEAMSCNLPVVTTRFGALPRAVESGDGVIFVESRDELVKGVESIQDSHTEVNTRDKVLCYSWENIEVRLEEIYRALVRSFT